MPWKPASFHILVSWFTLMNPNKLMRYTSCYSGSFVYAQYHLQNTHSNSGTQHNTACKQWVFCRPIQCVCAFVCVSVILKILYVTHKFCIFLSPAHAHRFSPGHTKHTYTHRHPFLLYTKCVFAYVANTHTFQQQQNHYYIFECDCACVRARVIPFFLLSIVPFIVHFAISCVIPYHIGHICWLAPIKSIRFFLLFPNLSPTRDKMLCVQYTRTFVAIVSIHGH